MRKRQRAERQYTEGQIMCARYYIDDFLVKQVEDELGRAEGEPSPVKGGDVHPSEKAPVITALPVGRDDMGLHGFPMVDAREDRRLHGSPMVDGREDRRLHGSPMVDGREDVAYAWGSMDWGFQRQYGKGLIINARSETVREKYTFRDCFAARRCVIPAHAFYEWDESKEKVTFKRMDGAVLYMAGVYEASSTGCRYVILTTEAPAAAADVHDRVPLILGRQDIAGWLYDYFSAVEMLGAKPPALSMYKEYEQQSFSF
jgi:putative SOS response-associated peptidase YedK